MTITCFTQVTKSRKKPAKCVTHTTNILQLSHYRQGKKLKLETSSVWTGKRTKIMHRICGSQFRTWKTTTRGENLPESRLKTRFPGSIVSCIKNWKFLIMQKFNSFLSFSCFLIVHYILYRNLGISPETTNSKLKLIKTDWKWNICTVDMLVVQSSFIIFQFGNVECVDPSINLTIHGFRKRKNAKMRKGRTPVFERTSTNFRINDGVLEKIGNKNGFVRLWWLKPSGTTTVVLSFCRCKQSLFLAIFLLLAALSTAYKCYLKVFSCTSIILNWALSLAAKTCI